MTTNGTQAVCIFNLGGTNLLYRAVIGVSRDLCNLTDEGNNTCWFQFQYEEDVCENRLKNCGLLYEKKLGGPDSAPNITMNFTSIFLGEVCCTLSSIPLTEKCYSFHPKSKRLIGAVALSFILGNFWQVVCLIDYLV